MAYEWDEATNIVATLLVLAHAPVEELSVSCIVNLNCSL